MSKTVFFDLCQDSRFGYKKHPSRGSLKIGVFDHLWDLSKTLGGTCVTYGFCHVYGV